MPSIFYKSDLFNPNNFALSEINPSLGDFLLNSTFCLIVVSILFWLTDKIDLQKYNNRLIISILLLLSLGSLLLFYVSILDIYLGSQYLLDLKLAIPSISWSFKIVGLLIFLIQSTLYLTIQYFCFNSFKKLNLTKSDYRFGVLLIGFIGIILVFYQIIPIYLLAGHIIYGFFILYFDLIISIKQYHFKSTISLVISAIFCSYLATYINYSQEIYSDFVKKQQFAKLKMDEGDSMSEFLIEIANESIRNSPKIKFWMSEDLINFDEVDAEIKSNHLKNWFDKYEINISYYNEKGENLKNKWGKGLESQWKYFVENGQNTLIENLLLINSESLNNTLEYVHRLKIEKAGGSSITLLIIFNRLENDAFSSKNLESIRQSSKELEFVKFSNNQIENDDFGKGDLDIELEKKLINNPDIYNKSLIINGFAYTALKNQKGQSVLVFSPLNLESELFRTFTFLFSLLVISFFILLILVTYSNSRHLFDQSYSTKIQVYFGMAFLFPLLVSMILIFNIIDKSHTKKETLQLKTIAENINSEILKSALLAKLNVSNKYFWEEEIRKLKSNYEVGFCLYSLDTELIATTNNTLKIDSGFVKLLKSRFQSQIFEKRTKFFFEIYMNKIDGLNLFYQPISNRSLGVIGILVIPYRPIFSLENNETNELFGSILSTFTLIFFLFLILSIIVSNHLTKPLKLIANYLHKTDFQKPNEPIIWKGKDEFGQLIDSYNTMLGKIEVGKKEISLNEKQIAWQDIAKQVAHEIKNPLTPMKLTLQHLEKTLEKESTTKSEIISKKIANLLYNID
ncbi:MAG: hypothetical protein V4683_14415, partial [Bacteroidota bacterium]